MIVVDANVITYFVLNGDLPSYAVICFYGTRNGRCLGYGGMS
jgi:hypothetical protein